MEQGTLLAQVYTARQAIPIQGAAVSVYSLKEGRRELERFERTDLSGRTGVISLPAPDESLSQTPGAGQPFASFEVTVSAEGYYSITVHGAQVFAGQGTIQDAEMLPLPENPNYENGGREYYSSPQKL